LAIAVMLISAPVSYFLLAPHDYLIPGLALGATGLAIKMLVIQFIGTNVQLYFNTKFLGISFKKWVTLQFKLIGIVYLLAFISHFVTRQISDTFLVSLNYFGMAQDLFYLSFQLAISGVLFVIMILILLTLAPNLVGIDRRDLMSLFGKKTGSVAL
jgi:hypothetical protein